MKTIAHLSDLHFGTENERVAGALLGELRRLAPSLVVVSGDLTQRARRRQFEAAAAYLESMPFPRLVVPGNHDVPLFDVVRRFATPLRRYRKFITPDLCPYHLDDEMAVLGINTARSLTWKSGRISPQQIRQVRERLGGVPPGRFKILVTHHPFIPPPGDPESRIDLVGQAALALPVIDECEVDLLLAGHLHHGYTGDIRTYYPATTRSVIVAQAGTAISQRIRSEPNAFNFITLDRDRIEVSVRVWQATGVFTETTRTTYRCVEAEWRREP